MSLPVLAGVTLPLPNTLDVTERPVEDAVQLAGGATSSYYRGHVRAWSLGWTRALEATRASLVAAVRAARGGPVTFVDVDGVGYVVRVDGDLGQQAVAGTDPTRWALSLSLVERAPR